MTFTNLGLDPALLRSLEDLGFEKPTDIQTAAIGPLLEGRSVIGQARTGSGKTAAFGLPLLQHITDPGKGVRALILAPTRELALQVSAALRDFAKYTRLRVLTVYGGAPYGPQLAGLREGADVVVGTPGRLIDLLERQRLDLSKVGTVVLDEADEMLRMGFIDDVETLMGATPEDRQVALFSATMPRQIRSIADRHVNNPVELRVERGPLTVDHIEQRWVQVPQQHKLEALLRILRVEPRGTTLIFTQTRAGCADVADALVTQGFAADALHGDMDQNARERVVARLRSRRLELVVATDVAARGIDIDHLTHVINMDLPTSTEPYVHRIGRTGRAGAKGIAISLITPRERGRLNQLERRLRVRIEPQQVPSDADIAAVRRQELKAMLQEASELDVKGNAAKLVADMAEAGDWTVEDIAAAAVRLLGQRQGLQFGEAENSRPPSWARKPEPREQRRPQRSTNNGPRFNNRPGRGEAPDPSTSIELFLAIGRNAGVQAGDIVGAITNTAGVHGAALGRITIGARASFVQVSPDTANDIIEAAPQVVLRGVTVAVKRAHPRTSGPTNAARAPHPSKQSARPPKRGVGPRKAGKKKGKKKPQRRAAAQD